MNKQQQPDESQPRKMVSLNIFKTFDEVGDSIEGHYMGFIREPGLNEKGKPFIGQHAILTPDGVVRFNETVQLKALENMPDGVFVVVTLTGSIKNQHGGQTKLFDVGVDADDFRRVRQMIHGKSMQAIAMRVDTDTGEVLE